MREVDASNLKDYFATDGNPAWSEMGLADFDLEDCQVAELAWGVSNIVLRVDTPKLGVVVKQSRKQLRTEIDWFSQLDRIWRETAMMRTLGGILPAGSVPKILFEDPANYLFAMSAIEPDHRVWKAELLDGQFDHSVFEKLATSLARIHNYDVQLMPEADRSTLQNREIFDELRLDPFYRFMATTSCEVAAPLEQLIKLTESHPPTRIVLADFSPKNILLTSHGPVIVDFETGHLGDPTFDVGFFLSHLCLKLIYHRCIETDGVCVESFASSILSFARTYLNSIEQPVKTNIESTEFETRCALHLAACMLSRVDGKSRVDYLNSDAQEMVRVLCYQILRDQPTSFIVVLRELLRCS